MSLFRNKDIAKQLLDFTGLVFGGTRYPTDIDGFIEFHDRVFIFIEVKHEGTELPTGQRLALERLVDAVAASGKKAILIVGDTHDEGELVDVASAIVREYRLNRTWHKPPNNYTTVRMSVNAFMKWAKEK